MEVTSKPWGVMPDGRRVDAFQILAPSGLAVTVSNYGATITSIKCPSKAGPSEEVTLCYSTLDELRTKSPYYGCTVGRVANRIAGGSFSLDGAVYKVPVNNGPNSLHGGITGFDKVLWTPRLYVKGDVAGVEFSYTSVDGEEGYPGTLHAVADYRLTASTGELSMSFTATVEGKATPINLCNHTYFNLSGDFKESVKGHSLTLHCPYYLPVNSVQIPTGEVAPVTGTPMDFTKTKAVGAQLLEVDGGGEPGYDHCYARSNDGAAAASLPLAPIAVLEHAGSGRKMTVSTNAPGVQLYTGNFLPKEAASAPHNQHMALCLETQNYPNAINTPHFPSAVLRPGEQYKHVAVHKFEW